MARVNSVNNTLFTKIRVYSIHLWSVYFRVIWAQGYEDIGVFLIWRRTFIEFSELTESDKTRKHELDSI